MSFSKFGKISYTAETKIPEFIRFLEQGKIAATRCKKCGKLYFPPRVDCSNCLASNEMEWQILSGKCKLITYTTLYFAPTGFEDDLPYTLAIVECDEGVRVFTRISKDLDPKELRVRMELMLVPVKLPNGNIIYEARRA